MNKIFYYKMKISKISFGTYQLNNNILEESLKYAIDIGYRGIDTAQLYKNYWKFYYKT